MTNREFFEKVANDERLAAEVREHAKKGIAALDKRNADRAAKPSKKALENEPIKERIVELVRSQENPIVASEIAANLDISTAKASALCRQLVVAEVLNETEVKVKGKGKVKGYTLTVAKEVADEESSDEE